MRISSCRCDRTESFIKYSVQANVWVFTIALKNSVWLGIHLFIFLQSQEQEKGSQLAEYAFTLSWATKSSAASINVKGFPREEKTKKKHTVSSMHGFISQSEHRKKHQTQRALTCYLSPYSPIAHIDSFWLLFFFPPLVVQKCLKNVQHGGQNSQIRATKSKRCTGGAESVRMNVNERQNYGKAQNALCSVTDAQGDNFFYHGNVSALKIHLTELFPLHMFITACS